MVAHHAVPNNTRAAFRTCRLLSYKHHTPLSPLECALPRCPVTVHSKQLTGSAKFFRMRTYIKTGGRGYRPFPPCRLTFTPKEIRQNRLSTLPYILPSSVCTKSFVSYSCENC